MAVTENGRNCSGLLSFSPERLERLDAFLEKKVADGTHPSMAARVWRRGVEIYHGMAGVSSPEGRPMSGDEIYPVASVTKPVVATLIAILQEDGELDLYNRVQEYLPEFTNKGADAIQVWHLLCHSSGMDDDEMYGALNTYIETEFGIKRPPNDCTREEDIEYCRKVHEAAGLEFDEEHPWFHDKLMPVIPIPYPTETRFSYCNRGYQMLLDIVERVTGESADDFARRRLFDPLGMPDTYWVLPEEKHDRVLRRGDEYAGAPWYNMPECYRNKSGSGGLKTTLYDLCRFGQMYLQNGTLDGHRILSPSSVRLFTSNHNTKIPASEWINIKTDSDWGLGWNVGKKDDLGYLRSKRTFDHGGYAGARIMVDPENEIVTAFYFVDREEPVYPLHGRFVNMICAALD